MAEIWQKIVSWVLAVVMAILTLFGIIPDEPKPEDPTTETTTSVSEETTTGEDIELPEDPTDDTTVEDTTAEDVTDDTDGTTKGDEITTLPIDDPDVQKEVGLLGFMYDPVDKVFYSAKDPWQRYFGYNELYDIMAEFFVMYIDTVRIKFKYDNLDWMIQLWKGQYGLVLMGAEVGVYYKEQDSEVDHYQCTDNGKRLKVGFTCYSYDEILFTRTYQETWWLTAFVPGKLDKFADRSQLSLRVRITLKDAEMTKAFVEGLRKEGVGFTEGNAIKADTYFVTGNNVYLRWNTDRKKTS